MSKKSLYLLGIALTILIGTWLHYSFCCCGCCEKQVPNEETFVTTTEEETQKEPSINNSKLNIKGFNFQSENSSYSTEKNFTFLNSNFDIIQPLSDSINLGIEELKKSIENSNNKFIITGKYSSKEENNSIFPNLGIARATAIKNHLITKGIPEDKLQVSSLLSDEITLKGDTLINSTIYNLNSINEAQSLNNWSDLKNEINSNPIRLYFNTGQSTINLTQTEKNKLGKIIQYINNVDNSKILITGHTDNTTGTNNTNEYYSAKRAEFAKDYLVSNGISAAKIVTEGKAETMPIANNETEEGRAKNRRAEISIQ